MPLVTYAGATTRTDPSVGLALPDRVWGWQAKIDGVYAEAITCPAGKIAAVVGRNGQPLRAAADLIGLDAGVPRAVLVGELEAHTEAGTAAARRRGWANLHLFDALALDGRDLRFEPFADRYQALTLAQRAPILLGLTHVDHWVPSSRGPRDRITGRHISLASCAPRDLRRLPLVPLVRGHADARALWAQVEAGALEGIVAVALDARAGARASKRKIKLTDTIDARVTRVGSGAIEVAWRGGTSEAGWQSRPEPFVVGTRRPLAPGDVIEVEHDGWYGSGVPRFVRIKRARADKPAR